MNHDEFRWNKKRKHYAYLISGSDLLIPNILITSKPIMVEKKNKKKTRITINIPLCRHPNSNKNGQFFLIPIIYFDSIESFDKNVFKNWAFDKSDIEKVENIKKNKQKNKSRLRHQLR